MATTVLTRASLPGALGEILVDVRTGDRKNPRPAVLIMHGFKGFKDWGMFPVIAERLARAGMSAISFNTSGSGVDNEGEFTRTGLFSRNTFTAELEDLHQVITAVRAGTGLGIAPPGPVGLLGHSRGGGMAIIETARNREIASLVSWAAIGSVDRWSAEAKEAWRRRGYAPIQNARTGQVFQLGTGVLDDVRDHAATTLDIGGAAARVSVPWLIVHGSEDETVSVEDARMLHASSGQRATLQVIDGAGHTFGATHPLAGLPAALDQAMTATVGWFARTLG